MKRTGSVEPSNVKGVGIKHGSELVHTLYFISTKPTEYEYFRVLTHIRLGADLRANDTRDVIVHVDPQVCCSGWDDLAEGQV